MFISAPVLPHQSPQPSLCPAALLSASRSEGVAQESLWWSNVYEQRKNVMIRIVKDNEKKWMEGSHRRSTGRTLILLLRRWSCGGSGMPPTSSAVLMLGRPNTSSLACLSIWIANSLVGVRMRATGLLMLCVVSWKKETNSIENRAANHILSLLLLSLAVVEVTVVVIVVYYNSKINIDFNKIYLKCTSCPFYWSPFYSSSICL